MAQVKAQVDKLLTDVSQMCKPVGLIADELLPLVTVKQKSGLFGKYGKRHLALEHSFQAGRGKYRRVEPIVRSTSSYLVESHGLEGLVTEDDYQNVEQPFDAEKDETMGLMTLIQIEKEYALSTGLNSASVLTQNVTLAGTAQLSDYTNSDPIGVFKVARQAVYDGCGLPPNVAWMSWEVANQLAYHPGILDALGYTQNRAGQLSEAELAKAMGVEKLLIAKGKYNSAKEGQTDVLASIWGKHIGFGQIASSAGKYQTSLGYKVALAGRGSSRVFKFPGENPPNSTKILCDDSYQFLITDPLAGYLVINAVA